jgi:glycosyltransferase involved in cell wall biosynthesis
MKVLVLHSELGVLRGGGENVTRHLFSAFASRGHCVHAAFTADRNGRYPIPLSPGLEPVPIAGYWSSNLGQATLSSVARYIPCDSRLRKHWDRVQQGLQWRAFAWHKRRFQRRIENEFAHRWHDFDAVYVHGDFIMASEVARHCPTVLFLPGPVPAECAGLLRAVHAVCTHDDALVRTRAFLGDQARELPLGLETQTFTPGASLVRSALGWTDGHVVLGYVGRLTHLKGVDLLAAAFPEIARDVPKARLLVVGSGQQQRHVRAALASETARGVVHFEMDVSHEQLPEWYRAMDLIVMPSRYENLSNSLLEALACGIPFVASDTGGNRKLAESGAGWLFEPESVPSLRQCLRHVLENCAELKVRGQLGPGFVRRQKSWAASAERLEAILESTLSLGGR